MFLRFSSKAVTSTEHIDSINKSMRPEYLQRISLSEQRFMLLGHCGSVDQ